MVTNREPVFGVKTVVGVLTIAFSVGGAWAVVQNLSADVKENYTKKEEMVRLEAKLDLLTYRIEELTKAVSKTCMSKGE